MARPKRKTSAVTKSATQEEPPASWKPPTPLSRVSLGVLFGIALVMNLPLLHYYFFQSPTPTHVTIPFHDDFSDPQTISQKYWSTGGLWRVVDGQLFSPGVKNNPLWLQASLPRDVAVEFDVRSMSPEGDIKVEIFGDGRNHASGYVLIHGGWKNSLSIIARFDEHAPPLKSLQAQARTADGDLVASGVYTPHTRVRVTAHPFRVEMGRTYNWRIERKGHTLSWYIDGQVFMTFDDPLPLYGPSFDRFGFSSWQSNLFFDNLRITPL